MIMKNDTILPLALLAGAGFLLWKNSARKSPLSGDDAADALRFLKAQGAPPELLAYLAKHPAALREYMQRKTINGKPVAASGQNRQADTLAKVLEAAKKVLDSTKEKTGKGGGGSGGGSGGGKPKGGATGKPSAPAALKNGTAEIPTATGQGTLPVSESTFQKELDLQFQQGNLTKDQYNNLLLAAQESGQFDAAEIGRLVETNLNELVSSGEITMEQADDILNGDTSLLSVNLNNAWDQLREEETAWDEIAAEMGWDTQASDELDGLVDYWQENSEGDEWDQFWQDWNAGEYDYENELTGEDWSGWEDWNDFADWNEDGWVGWAGEPGSYAEDYFTEAAWEDWNSWGDTGYWEQPWADDSSWVDWSIDAIKRPAVSNFAAPGIVNPVMLPVRVNAANVGNFGNPLVAAPLAGGLGLLAIGIMTLPAIISAFKSTPPRKSYRKRR